MARDRGESLARTGAFDRISERAISERTISEGDSESPAESAMTRPRKSFMIPQLGLPHGGQSPHREHKREWTYSTAASVVTLGSPQASPGADNRGSVSPRTKRTTVLHYDVLRPADETPGSVTHRDRLITPYLDMRAPHFLDGFRALQVLHALVYPLGVGGCSK